MEIFIRQILEKDAQEVASLSRQLGYDPGIEQTLENINAILNNTDHSAFVAIHEDKVIGWIGVCQAIQIESVPYCEIHGLIVDNLYRKQGVGKMLIEKAKIWCLEKGNAKLRVRCNIRRTETHLFYQHLNFKEVKEQKVFEINT
jgi:GNAT superfamily N-acetyltransferase